VSRVFVSYSRMDAGFATWLRDALVARGLEVWLDVDEIGAADDWRSVVAAAIGDAEAFVFVVSRDSLRSDMCLHELRLALAYETRVVALLRDATPDLPNELARVEHVAAGDPDVADRLVLALAGA
jgi:TIR domain-containing protein